MVEVLVSMIILACGLLASLVGLTSAIKHVMINEMRNEAIKIAQEQCDNIRNQAVTNWGGISSGQQTVNRQIRKQQVPFTLTTNVQNLSGLAGATGISGTASGMLVQVNVSWNYKNQQYWYPNPNTPLQTVVRQSQ